MAKQISWWIALNTAGYFEVQGGKCLRTSLCNPSFLAWIWLESWLCLSWYEERHKAGHSTDPVRPPERRLGPHSSQRVGTATSCWPLFGAAVQKAQPSTRLMMLTPYPSSFFCIIKHGSDGSDAAAVSPPSEWVPQSLKFKNGLMLPLLQLPCSSTLEQWHAPQTKRRWFFFCKCGTI